MQNFVEWLDSGPGFLVNRVWDDKAKGFIHKTGKIRLWPHQRRIFEHVFTLDEKTEKGWSDDVIHKYDIQYPNTTTIQVPPSQYSPAAGGQQALTLFDELWGFVTEKSQRLWEEMTPIPTEKLSLRVVVTYAGFEGGSQLLWDLYEKTVLNGKRLKEFPDLPCFTDQTGTIFAYWDHEPTMPGR